MTSRKLLADLPRGMCSPWNPTGGEMVGAHRARGVGSTPTPALIPASSAGPPPVYHIAAKLVKAGTLTIVPRTDQPPPPTPIQHCPRANSSSLFRTGGKA